MDQRCRKWLVAPTLEKGVGILNKPSGYVGLGRLIDTRCRFEELHVVFQ